MTDNKFPAILFESTGAHFSPQLASTMGIEVWDGFIRAGTFCGSFSVELEKDLDPDVRAYLYQQTHYGTSNGPPMDVTEQIIELKEFSQFCSGFEPQGDDDDGALKVFRSGEVILLGKSVKIVRDRYETWANCLLIGKLTKLERAQRESRQALAALDLAKANNRLEDFNLYYDTN